MSASTNVGIGAVESTPAQPSLAERIEDLGQRLEILTNRVTALENANNSLISMLEGLGTYVGYGVGDLRNVV
jgi:hypothetical protein